MTPRGGRFGPVANVSDRVTAVIRALPPAASVAWNQLTGDPVRAAVLAHRSVPRRLKGPAGRVLARFGGPLARALVQWDRGEWEAAASAAAGRPEPRAARRLTAFALAVDRPDVAARTLAGVPADDRARPLLQARLAWREGRLRDALDMLRDTPLPVILQKFKLARFEFLQDHGRRWGRMGRLRRGIEGELRTLTPGPTRSAPDRRRPLDPAPGRVLHLVTNALPYKNAGYTVRTQQIALAQRAAGLDAQVVTRLGFPVAQGVLDGRRRVEVDGVPYHRLLPAVIPASADAALARGVQLAADLVAGLRPAVLHAASNHVNAQIALALRDRFGLPVVYEVRGFLEDSWLSRVDGRDPGCDHYALSRDQETRCMREADLVVTLGEAMAGEIVARGISADKVLVVPNAVDDVFLEALPDASVLRAALGIPDDAAVVGTVSTFYGYEGIDTLLRAGAELRRRGAPVRLLLVGDGPELAALRQLAAELELDAAVTFTGRVAFADVRRYHAVLDIFAVPRTNDRVCHLVTPLKPVEAMASGLPVVASDVRALAELVEPGVTGTLTSPEDPHALADSLESLLYSPELCRDLGRAGRDKVARHRTWRANARRYRTAYATLGARMGV
ncbi:MAG: glycosyltransferase [Streptosporangiales bacterium]|nr:glycosyltransferase [Streptosporangiales bacterium]